MIATTALMALALAGSPPPEQPQISYDVKIIDTVATEWRGEFYRYCKRVRRDGRSTVWTLDESKVGDLLKCAQGRAESTVSQPPRVTVVEGALASFAMSRPRSFVVDADRVAEGPVDHAHALAYRPSVEQIVEGAQVSLTGKRSPMGVATHVKIDSCWVGHVATVESREMVENSESGRNSLGIILEMPQVVDARVDADYEIPSGESLLVSLGSATTLDARKRPVVMERLALISAKPIVMEREEVRRTAFEVEIIANGRTFSSEIPRRRNSPPLPSRSLLPAIGPDGKPVALPPLPDDQVAKASLSGPPVPRATPQMEITTKIVDPSVVTTRFEATPVRANVDGATLATGKVQKLRIPVGGPLAIEMEIRLVPIAPRD